MRVGGVCRRVRGCPPTGTNFPALSPHPGERLARGPQLRLAGIGRRMLQGVALHEDPQVEQVDNGT